MKPNSALRPSVAAVIVTYNRMDKLRTSLGRTLELPFSRVVVVDNASTDGTSDWLDAQFDARLQVIHEPENRGGAGGFAHGFAEVVRSSDIEWLVCFDDDAYPARDVLDTFAALAPGARVGAIAAAVYLPGGQICAMNRPGINPFDSISLLWRASFRRMGHFGIPDDAYTAEMCEVSYSSFVGLFVRCALVRGTLGLPRAELFIYGDDLLYTLAIARQGYQILFAPTIHFTHDCKNSFEQRRVFDPVWRVYYALRNQITFYRELSGAYFYPAVMPLLLLSWLRAARHYPDRRRLWRVARAAIADGLRGDFSRPHREVLNLTIN